MQTIANQTTVNGNSQSARKVRGAIGDTNGVLKLKELSQALAVAADALELVIDRDIRHGLDFYEEVRRLEMTLIRQALEFTGGSQVKAAKLLNLRNTTLNSKIRNYQILMP